MNKKIKIIHLITGMKRGGGAEKFIYKTLPILNNDENLENQVCVLADETEYSKELEKSGVKIYYLNIKRGRLNIKSILKYRKIIKEFKPDIQINYLPHADIFGRIFGKIFGVKKIIAFIRNRHEEFKFFWPDHLTKFLITEFLATSDAIKKFYIEKHKISPEKITTISNSIDLEEMKFKIQEKPEFDYSDSKKYLITVARLHPQKDLATLIRAFEITSKKIENLELIICGDGPEKENLIKLTNELNLKNKIHLIGNVNNVYSLLFGANIFVLPSKFEGMSNALLEAMAVGLPVIISNIPENIELVEEDVNGEVFEVGDFQQLSEKIIDLIKNDNRIVKYSRNNKNKIDNNYSIIKILDSFKNKINSIF